MSATDLAAKLGVTLVTNLCDLVARYFPEPVGHDFDEAAERDLVEREDGDVAWSPFAQDGKLRDDLFAQERVGGVWVPNQDDNEGWYLSGAFGDGNGPSQKPSIKTDDQMIEAEQEVAPGRDLFAEHTAHCQGCAAADTDSPDPESGDADGPAPRTSPTSVSGDGRPTSELLAEAAVHIGDHIGIGTPSYVRDLVDELWDRSRTFRIDRS